MSGLLNDIKRTPTALSSEENVSIGYGSTAVDELVSLQNAGYTKYVLPTLAWQGAIALVISGFVSFLFYMTWTYEEPNQKKKFTQNKK